MREEMEYRRVNLLFKVCNVKPCDLQAQSCFESGVEPTTPEQGQIPSFQLAEHQLISKMTVVALRAYIHYTLSIGWA